MRTLLLAVTVALVAACSPDQPDTEAVGVDRPGAQPLDTSPTPSGTAADLLSQIENRKGRIEVALGAGNLPEAARLTEELHELAHGLEQRAAKLPPDQQRRLYEGIARVDSAAHALESAAADNRGPAADREFQRLKEALRTLNSVQIPS